MTRIHYTITNPQGNVTLIHPLRTAYDAAADAQRHESPLITLTVVRNGVQETQAFPCIAPSPEDGRLIRRPTAEIAQEVHLWCLVRGLGEIGEEQ